MKKAMLIWNPTAGRIETEGQVRQAMRVLGENGWDVHIENSQSSGHMTELATKAVQAQMDAVFVAGGDGSLARVVAGLVGSDTALGVLPTGTANVWAREIGLPVSTGNMVVKSASQLATGQVYAMDVGVCNGFPFFLWAGFGLDGRVVEQLERKRSRFVKQLNEIYYSLAILRCAAGWQGMRIQVKADAHEIEGKYMVAVAGNIQYYAGGLAKLSPAAAWDDGKMELWLFGSGKRGGAGIAVRHLWNLGWGRHVKDREILCLPFQRLKLTFETDEWMQMDGDPWGKVREVDVMVKKRALRVLVPGKE